MDRFNPSVVLRRVLLALPLGVVLFIAFIALQLIPPLSQPRSPSITVSVLNLTPLPSPTPNTATANTLNSPDSTSSSSALTLFSESEHDNFFLKLIPTGEPPRNDVASLLPTLEPEPTGFAVTLEDLELDVELLKSLNLPIPPAGGRLQRGGGTEWGIQINGCDQPLQPALDLAIEHGFRWIKQQVRWGDLEYINAQGKRALRWSCLDQVIGESKRRGLRVLLSVTTAPVHLRPPFYRDTTLGPPADLSHLAQFLSALLSRYEKQIDAIEIWNEPNLDAEWKEGINPLRYTFLLKVAALTIRLHDPNIIIISGGLAPIAQTDYPRFMNDLDFWAVTHENGGALWVDCIGYHANGPPPDGFFDGVLTRYRNAIAQQDPALRRPLCLTEVSFSLPIGGQTPPDFAWAVGHTEEEQAQRFRKWIAMSRTAPDLHLAIVFNLNYLENGRPTPNSIAALARPDLKGLTLAVFREEFGLRSNR